MGSAMPIAPSVRAMARYDPVTGILFRLAPGRPPDRRPISDPLRESGVARGRSAAATSIYAGLVAQALRQEDPAGPSTATILLSTTSTVDVCRRFELTGLEEDWDLVDPFALPHSIPSAGATCVSKILDADAGAIVLIGGCGSFGLALELAQCILGGQAERVVLIGSEQRLAAIGDAMPARTEGAVGLDLCASGDSLFDPGSLTAAAGADALAWDRDAAPVGSSLEPFLSLFRQAVPADALPA